MSDELTALILKATREMVQEQGIATGQEFGPEARLFGEGGALDSMALVSLVIAVEQAIEEKYGVAVALADEKALSQRSSPYRTVNSLAAYAAAELAGKRKNG